MLRRSLTLLHECVDYDGVPTLRAYITTTNVTTTATSESHSRPHSRRGGSRETAV